MAEKLVLCIRHGESTFNAAYRETGRDPLHIDARLSEAGLAQVREAALRLRSVPVELVVTSPLTRALQTTEALFADHPSQPTILVDPQHREHGLTTADIGRSPAVLASEFPGFALSHLPEVWWHNEGEPDERGVRTEPDASFEGRVDIFRTWLAKRPEQRIAVVGHGTFFLRLLGRWLENCEVAELRLSTDPFEGRTGVTDF